MHPKEHHKYWSNPGYIKAVASGIYSICTLWPFLNFNWVRSIHCIPLASTDAFPGRLAPGVLRRPDGDDAAIKNTATGFHYRLIFSGSRPSLWQNNI